MRNIKQFVATKAFIRYKGKILILRESSKYLEGANAGKYDVVGGRIEPGQRFDKSLKREVKEETGLTIKIGKPFYVGEWRPTVKDKKWQIIGTFFDCTSITDRVRLSKDHDNYLWIEPNEYKNFNLIPNLVPAFKAYLNK